MQSPVDLAEDDRKIRETFFELRRSCLDIEKIKFERQKRAAFEQLGIEDPASNDDRDAAANASSSNNNSSAAARWALSIVANWRQILVLSFFILVVQWRRLANLYDAAFGNFTLPPKKT